jgi:hypothetical protein
MYSTADTDTMDIPVNSTIVNILSCTQDQHLHFCRHDGRLIMHRTHTQTYGPGKIRLGDQASKEGVCHFLQGLGSGSGSGSGLDPDSIRSVDPDPYSEP